MSLNIIDALKVKGSTGGNTIAEAIDNLPSGSGGGGDSGVFVVKMVDVEADRTRDDIISATLDTSFNDLNNAVDNGKLIVAAEVEAYTTDVDDQHKRTLFAEPYYLMQLMSSPLTNPTFFTAMFKTPNENTIIFAATDPSDSMRFDAGPA